MLKLPQNDFVKSVLLFLAGLVVMSLGVEARSDTLFLIGMIAWLFAGFYAVRGVIRLGQKTGESYREKAALKAGEDSGPAVEKNLEAQSESSNLAPTKTTAQSFDVPPQE